LVKGWHGGLTEATKRDLASIPLLVDCAQSHSLPLPLIEILSNNPKIGYISLMADRDLENQILWWKVVWKANCPTKSKLLMLCLVEKKVPTWNVSQRIFMIKLGWCPLSKNNGENASYLFMTYPFYQQVWKKCRNAMGHKCMGRGGL